MRRFSPEAQSRMREHQRWYGTRHEATPPVRNLNDEYAEYYGVYRQPYETDADLDARVLEARGRMLNEIRPLASERKSLWGRLKEWWLK